MLKQKQDHDDDSLFEQIIKTAYTLCMCIMKIMLIQHCCGATIIIKINESVRTTAAVLITLIIDLLVGIIIDIFMHVYYCILHTH